MQSSESTISSNQSFSCFLCPQRPTPRPTGAQEVRTSRWPAGTWSWHSPPSSACTSRGRHGHNDCGEHLWILSDIADGWNRIWFVWKAFWGRKIIHSTLCGIFFLLCFQVIFFLCHVNTMILFYYYCCYHSFLSSVLIVRPPYESVCSPSPTSLPLISKSPQISPPISFFRAFFFRRWRRKMRKKWHFHLFLYMA